MIRLRGLVKEYPSRRGATPVRAVDDISLEVPEGSFFTLLGPSGCGKTTTLRCVAGLERPTAGSVGLGGRTVASGSTFVPANKRDIGMVFQSYAVWPHLTVFDNVAFPLQARRRTNRSVDVRERVMEVLALMGLTDYADRKPAQLSGGQQQRLSLARALAPAPACLLFDEPLSNLDAGLRERMRTELRALQQSLGFTALLVTHDQAEALSISDRIAVMSNGKIEQVGSPQDIYYKPTNAAVAEFIGSANLLHGTVVGVVRTDGEVQVDTTFGTVSCAPPDGFAVKVGDAVRMSIRPEDVSVMSASDQPEQRAQGRTQLDGEVVRVTFAGPYTEIQVAVRPDREPLLVQVPSRRQLVRGDEVSLSLSPQACRLLPERSATGHVASSEQTGVTA